MILQEISFDKYYVSSIEIKDVNALIDNKPFFDQPKKLMKNLSRSDDRKLIRLLMSS